MAGGVQNKKKERVNRTRGSSSSGGPVAHFKTIWATNFITHSNFKININTVHIFVNDVQLKEFKPIIG